MSAVKLTDGLTKRQHFVALLIMLPSVPLSIPLALLVFATHWASIAAEAIYYWVGWPFLAVRRQWLVRCERVNSARTLAQGQDNG